MSGQMLYGNSPVTPGVAENLSTVFACVSAISSALSALPVLIFQILGKIRSEVSSGAIWELIHNGPNQWQSWPEFVEMLVAQILLRGNGLVELVSDRFGNIVSLRVIPWDWVNIYMLPSGKLVYDVYDQPGIWAPAQGRRRRLLQHEVIHIRDRSDDGLVGKSRLQRAASVFRDAQTVHDFAAAAFRNGLFPSGVIQTEAILSADQREQMNNALVKNLSGSHNAARALVLDQGLKWQSLTATSPEDSETLDSRKFTTWELCRLFGVPPPLVQDFSFSSFTNSEQAGRWFGQYTLLPWVRKIEASFNRALFEGADYELVLDMSSFDRGDPVTRWRSHAVAAQNGILSINEIREVEGWGPKANEG